MGRTSPRFGKPEARRLGHEPNPAHGTFPVPDDQGGVRAVLPYMRLVSHQVEPLPVDRDGQPGLRQFGVVHISDEHFIECLFAEVDQLGRIGVGRILR